MRLGVDLDSVMFDFPAAVNDVHERVVGGPLAAPVALWDDVLTHSAWSTYSELFAAMAEHGGWERCHELPLPQALPSVAALVLAGHDITFVTSRHKAGADAAREWHACSPFAPFTRMVTDAPHAKNQAAPWVDVFVDDSPHVLDALCDEGVDYICFDQPWNRHNPLHLRARGWPDVLSLIAGWQQ